MDGESNEVLLSCKELQAIKPWNSKTKPEE